MKTFEITVSGKTLTDVIYAIEEAKRVIEMENTSGFNSNDDGEYSFDSSGEYGEDELDEDSDLFFLRQNANKGNLMD